MRVQQADKASDGTAITAEQYSFLAFCGKNSRFAAQCTVISANLTGNLDFVRQAVMTECAAEQLRHTKRIHPAAAAFFCGISRLHSFCIFHGKSSENPVRCTALSADLTGKYRFCPVSCTLPPGCLRTGTVQFPRSARNGSFIRSRIHGAEDAASPSCAI